MSCCASKIRHTNQAQHPDVLLTPTPGLIFAIQCACVLNSACDGAESVAACHSNRCFRIFCVACAQPATGAKTCRI